MKINNHIVLDFNKTKQVDTQTIQCDMNSRFVRVSLRHNNSPIDLSDVRVCIMAVKPDGKEIFNDCTVIDAQNGIAEFEITKQMGIVVGEVECQIKLFGKEKLLSSSIFNLSVSKSLFPNSQDSKDQLNTLIDSINRVDEWDAQFEQKYNGLEQEYANGITEIKELVVGNDLVERMSEAEQGLAQTNAQLSKVNSELIDTKNNKKFVTNYTSIQEAINDCKSGDELHFQPKDYTISSPLILKSNVSYHLNGCRLKGDNVESVIKAVNESNFKIINGTISGAIKFGINLFGVSNVLLDNVTCSENMSDHFNHSGANVNGAFIKILNSKFVNNQGNGFRLWSSTSSISQNIEFKNCHFNNNLQHGLLGNPEDGLTNSQDIMLDSCFAIGNGSNEIYSGFALHYMSNVTVNNCKSHLNMEHGFVFMDGVNFNMTGCISKNNGFSGLRIQGDTVRPQSSTTGVKYVNVCANIFDGNGTQGVDAGKVKWSNGITIGENCHNLNISNNIIVNHVNGFPIRFFQTESYSDCTNCIIDGNVLNNNVHPTIGENIIQFDGSMVKTSFYGSNLVKGVKKDLFNTPFTKHNYSCVNFNINSSSNILGLHETRNYDIVQINTLAPRTIDTILIDTATQGYHLILFFNQSSSNPITLKSTGNLKIGQDVTSIAFNNSDVAEFIYDGENWRLIGKTNL